MIVEILSKEVDAQTSTALPPKLLILSTLIKHTEYLDLSRVVSQAFYLCLVDMVTLLTLEMET